MSSSLTSSPDPASCFSAQIVGNGGTINPDVGGLIVGISNIIINALLPLLLAFSSTTENVRTSVYMLYSQVLPILLAITASIGNANLTLFDVKYGISLTASPVSIYVSYSAARELLGIESSLFKRLGYEKGVPLSGLDDTLGKLAIYIPAFLIPALWFALAYTLSFSGTAFIDSYLCEGMTFSSWSRYMAQTYFVGSLSLMQNFDMHVDIHSRGGLGVVAVIVLWFYSAYTAAHLEEIFQDYSEKIQKKSNHAFPIRWGYRVVRLPLSIWQVITKNHSWFPYIIAAVLYWSWYLGMARGLQTTPSISYGQILSIFSTTIFATIELWWLRKKDFAKFVTSLHTAVFLEILFIVCGPSTETETDPKAIANNDPV